MPFDLIRVCVFGQTDPAWGERVQLRSMRKKEAAGFDIHLFADDAELPRLLVELRPQVFVSFGEAGSYQQLWEAPLDVRRRWIHLDDSAMDPADVADRIMTAFISSATRDRHPDKPLVSVFTPTYLTGAKIERPLRSLLAQSYPNWEWILYDDSPDDGQTFEQMRQVACHDHRIIVFRAGEPCGRIGEVKRRACGLARGAILVELDHDDELTPHALRHVIEAYRQFPDAGFFFTDWAEVYESGGNATYGDDFAYGFGTYRTEWLNGRQYQVARAPDLNAKTIRHIVSVPNHLRAWTRKAYHEAGGHNPEVHVCDDYELIVRTFLTTRMVHIERFGYIQYYNNASTGNTQRQRNAEIQRLVQYFRNRYNEQIHDRLIELGVEDFLWRDGDGFDWNRTIPAETPYVNYLLP